MPDKRTVRLLCPHSLLGEKWTAYLAGMAPILEEKFPTVRFEVAGEAHPMLENHLRTPGPDITVALIGISTLPRLVREGTLMRLDQVLKREQMEAFRAPGLAACSLKDTLYGIPKYLEITTVFHNPDRAEPPRSWRGLVDTARRCMTQGDGSGLIFAPGNSFHYILLDYLWSRGHTGDPADLVAGDAGLEGLHFIRELFDHPRLVDFKVLSREAYDRFLDGAAPFILHSADGYFLNRGNGKNTPVRYTVPDENGSRRHISPLSGFALCIPEKAANPGFALRVLGEFLDYDRNAAVHETIGFDWGMNSFAKYRTREPVLENLLHELDTRAWPLTRSLRYYDAIRTVNDEIWALINRHRTPAEAHENIIAGMKNNPGMNETASPVDKVIAYIDENYHTAFSITGLPEKFGISYRHLNRLFRIAAGRSPKEYLLDLRMKKARRLLTDTRLPVGEVALRVGYADPYVFSKMFRKKTGKSPTQFRGR